MIFGLLIDDKLETFKIDSYELSALKYEGIDVVLSINTSKMKDETEIVCVDEETVLVPEGVNRPSSKGIQSFSNVTSTLESPLEIPKEIVEYLSRKRQELGYKVTSVDLILPDAEIHKIVSPSVDLTDDPIESLKKSIDSMCVLEMSFLNDTKDVLPIVSCKLSSNQVGNKSFIWFEEDIIG